MQIRKKRITGGKMKPRKGYVKSYVEYDPTIPFGTIKEKQRNCFIHGIFAGSDSAGPMAVVEFEDGVLQESSLRNTVLTELSCEE